MDPSPPGDPKASVRLRARAPSVFSARLRCGALRESSCPCCDRFLSASLPPPAVAWLPQYFRKHPHSTRPGLEANHQTFSQNLRDGERHINGNHEVGDLCASFLNRVDDLVKKKGERLKSRA